MEDIRSKCNQIVNLLKFTTNKNILTRFVTFMLKLSF